MRRVHSRICAVCKQKGKTHFAFLFALNCATNYLLRSFPFVNLFDVDFEEAEKGATDCHECD